MTCYITLIQDFQPYTKNYAVRIADGSISKVYGTSFVILSKNLTLESVLLVSKLDCNLLSISQLAREKNYVTKFYPNHCVFKDLNSGQMIGNVELHLGLYMFKVTEPSRRQTHKTVDGKYSFSTLKPSNDSDIMLWHYHLGYLSPLYLKELFPFLFNKNADDFTCEFCQLFKHVCNLIHIKLTKNLIIFH